MTNKGQGAYDVEGVLVPREGGGFHHQYSCNENVHPIPKAKEPCSKKDPRIGFQIGGYHSHMWFERHDYSEVNDCVNWMIASDGDLPTKDGSAEIQFHLSDFRQLEEFVKFWGKELRQRGWVSDEQE
jgi:hypothetical protein